MEVSGHNENHVTTQYSFEQRNFDCSSYDSLL